MPDAQELLAGTNPHDPASVLRLGNLAKTAAGMQMQFQTLTGKTYRIETTDDLTSNQWRPLTEPIPGDGHPVIILDTAAPTRSQRFYRIVLVQPKGATDFSTSAIAADLLSVCSHGGRAMD